MDLTFTATPTTPFTMPFPNPNTPSFSAPRYGYPHEREANKEYGRRRHQQTCLPQRPLRTNLCGGARLNVHAPETRNSTSFLNVAQKETQSPEFGVRRSELVTRSIPTSGPWLLSLARSLARSPPSRPRSLPGRDPAQTLSLRKPCCRPSSLPNAGRRHRIAPRTPVDQSADRRMESRKSNLTGV